MKTIGLIGGMSWESSVKYYRLINEKVRDRLGGLHSSKSLMYSVDFGEIERLQRQGKWEELTALMIDAAKNLEKGGADFILICTNTMHKMAEAVQENIAVPLLHIADATAKKVKAEGIRKVGLLGTLFTMEELFYKGRLTDNYGLQVLIPDRAERELVHQVIFEELCAGKIKPDSKEHYIRIMNRLAEKGAEGIILGCTEIGLLVGENDARVPLFDTTVIHAEAAVEYALIP